MKRIISAVLLLVLCCTLLTGCFCKHEWQDATCTTPTTCALCDKTEGEALGHMAGDFVDGEVDFEAKTVRSYQNCKICGESLHSEINDLTSFVSGDSFVYTPNQFNRAMDNRFSNYTFEIDTLDSGALISMIYNASGSAIGAIMYVTEDSESITMADLDSAICEGMICYWYTQDAAVVVELMKGILCGCDITITDASSDGTLSTIIDTYSNNASYSKNGVSYLLTINDGHFVFLIAVND